MFLLFVLNDIILVYILGIIITYNIGKDILKEAPKSGVIIISLIWPKYINKIMKAYKNNIINESTDTVKALKDL